MSIDIDGADGDVVSTFASLEWKVPGRVNEQ